MKNFLIVFLFAISFIRAHPTQLFLWEKDFVFNSRDVFSQKESLGLNAVNGKDKWTCIQQFILPNGNSLYELIPINQTKSNFSEMISICFLRFINKKKSTSIETVQKLERQLNKKYSKAKINILHFYNENDLIYELILPDSEYNKPEHELVRIVWTKNGLHRASYLKKTSRIDPDHKNDWLLALKNIEMVAFSPLDHGIFESMTFIPPDSEENWNWIHKRDDSNGHIRSEWIPPEQSILDFSEIIYHDFTPSKKSGSESIIELAQNIQNTYDELNKDAGEFNLIQKINDNDVIFETIIHTDTGSETKYHEIVRVFWGKKGLHFIAYQKKGPQLNMYEREKWSDVLKNIKLNQIISK